MGTRNTLISGAGFTLFSEYFEEDRVFLTLDQDLRFEAEPGRITVGVPLEVWEVIRKHSPARFGLADQSDVDLTVEVARRVDARIQKVEAQRRDGNDSAFVRTVGMMVYGSVDSPREQQIASGIEWHLMERARQRLLRDRIAALQAAQRPSEGGEPDGG